jgi:plastocyanin
MTRARLAFLAGTLALLAATTTAALALTESHVNQSGLQFSVVSLHIHRGDSVIFSNGDRTSHNITATGPGMNFNGGLQRPGENTEVMFTARGAYQVSCGIHPRMSMSVNVD